MRTREPRRKVLIRAQMRSGDVRIDIMIHNMSSRGLLAQSINAPARGDYVEIRKAAHVLVGRVVWASGQRFGVRVQDAIDMDGLIADVPRPSVGPAHKDKERRDSYRRAESSQTGALERSRRLSTAAQFGTLVLVGGAGALFAAAKVRDLLAQPLAAAAAAM